MPTKTASDILVDIATRHTVYLLRYSTATYRRHLKLIDEAIADIAYQLSKRAPASGAISSSRLAAVLSDIETTSKELYAALSSAVDGDLKALAAYEAKFQIDSINHAFPIEMALITVTGPQIHAAAMAQPFQGRILRDWWKDQEYGVRQAYKSAVRLGFVEGESIPQIVARVKNVGELSKRQSESIIRTAVNHVAQVARNKSTEANAEIFSHEEWVSVLDGRTSAVCRGRDGEKYDIGKGPQPPAHFGCRSQRIPITKSWEELGLDQLSPDDKLNERAYVADKRKLKDIPAKDRDKLIGQTTAKSYNEWLKTQPRSFVEDVLGKTKAKLYLDGDLSLDKFIDRQGEELTLEQLGKREAAAFQRAGID